MLTNESFFGRAGGVPVGRTTCRHTGSRKMEDESESPRMLRRRSHRPRGLVDLQYDRRRRPKPRRDDRAFADASSCDDGEESDDSSGSGVFETWYHQHEVFDKKVDNITVDFFYKPRTLTLLVVLLVTMFIFSFWRCYLIVGAKSR